MRGAANTAWSKAATVKERASGVTTTWCVRGRTAEGAEGAVATGESQQSVNGSCRPDAPPIRSHDLARPAPLLVMTM